jgi:hypothetical protein
VERAHARVAQQLLAPVAAEVGAHHQLGHLLAHLGERPVDLHPVEPLELPDRREVEDAVDEQRGLRARRVVGEGGCRRRGEVAAGGVAADGQTRRVAAEALRLARRPADRRDAVVEGRREGVLGRQPVVHVHDQVAGLGEAVRELPVRGRASANPAASVQVGEHGVRSRALRHHHVGRDPIGDRQGFGELAHLRQIGVQDRGKAVEQAPHVLRRLGRALRHELGQDVQVLGIEIGHGLLPHGPGSRDCTRGDAARPPSPSRRVPDLYPAPASSV